MQDVAVDTQYMRGINAAAVLNVLRAAGQLSVSELADTTGLSRQAVTRALAGLEASGLVVFRAPETSVARSGRPAQSVEFNAGAGYVLGVSVHPGGLRVALSDLRGAFVARRDFDLPAGAAVHETTVDAVRTVIGEAGLDRAQVWAACIGVPGIVDADSGRDQAELQHVLDPSAPASPPPSRPSSTARSTSTTT